MKKFLISLLTVFMMASLAACGNTSDAESVSSAKVLTKKLANESDKKIEISEDIVLTEPVEIVGKKEIVGNGTITVAASDMDESYIISVADGAELTVGGKTTINLSGLAGGIHVKEGATLTIQDEAVVKGASQETANALIEGTFNMNGGKITSGYTNILCAGKSTFTWNAGTVSNSAFDAIVVEEDAKITITSADAKLTSVVAKGLYLYGEGMIENVTMTDSMDSMIKVGPKGKLTVKNGKISDAGLHGIDNEGELLVAGGTIFANYDSGVCNTGTFEMTGGTIMNNKNKGVLNKAGTAKIVSAAVVLSGNRFAVGNEEGAYFELANAKLMQSTTTNIYAYGGEMYIHDIVLATSGSNNTRVVAANVRMEDMEIKGINASGSRSMHGLLMEGGTVTAKNVIIGNTTGNAIRNKGGNFQGENITIKDVKNVGISNTNQDVTEREGIINITNVTVENVKNNNLLVEGGTCTLTNATLERCATNNIKITDGKLVLKKSTVNGNVADAKENNHAIYMTGGTIEANNVKVQNAAGAMLRINGEEAVFEGKKVTFKNAGNAGINQSLGTVKIDELKTSGIKKNNIAMAKGTTELTNSVLGPVPNNSIRLTSEGKLVLTDVEIQGHVKGTKEDCHAIFPTNGTIIGTNLNIHDVAGVAVRVNGEKAKVELNNVNIDGAGYMAYRIGAGDVTVTNTTTKDVKESNVVVESKDGKFSMTNATLCPTENNNVRVNNGTTNFKNVDIQGTVEGVKETVHGFFVSKGTTVAKDITISDAKVAAIRVNNDAKVTMDDVEIKNPGQLGLQINAGTTVITGLTTSGVPSNNIQLYGEADVTVKESTLGKNADNSVRVDDKSILVLEDVVIKGHTEKAADNAHGIYAVGESKVTSTNLTVKNVNGAAIRTVGTPEVTLNEIEIKDVVNYGFRLGGGTVVVTNLTTEGVVGNNFAIEDKSCDVTVKEAVLCATEGNNIRINNGTTYFENVEVNGHVDGVTEVVHGFFVTKGKTTVKNLTIKDAKASAIRVNGACEIMAEDVTISNAGDCGISANDGTTNITNLTTADVKNRAVNIYGSAKVELKNAEMNTAGSGEYAIYSDEGEDHELIGENITIANVTYGIGGKQGTVKLTDVTSSASYRNVDAKGVSVELNQAIMNKTSNNNVVADGAGTVLTLNDVQILGNTGSNTGNHGLYVPNGTVIADALTVQDTSGSAVRMNKATGTLTATNVTFKDLGTYGLQVNGGTIDITGLTTSGIKERNVYQYGESTITLSNAILDTTESSYVNDKDETVATGNIAVSKGTLTLNAVEVKGTTAGYGIHQTGGTINVQNALSISNTKLQGIYKTGGTFEAIKEGVSVVVDTTNDKVDGITNAGGAFSANNLTVKNTTGSGIQNQNGGTMNLTNVYVTGVKNWHSIKNSGSESILTVNGGTFDKTPSNNVVADSGIVNLNGIITINGTKANHAIQTANTGVVNLDGELYIDGAKATGIYAIKTGEFNSTEESKITISNSGAQNVYVDNTAKATLYNATLGKTTDNNVRVIAGEITIVNSVVEGHVSGTNKNIHGILISNGKGTLTNVTIKDTIKSGLRTNHANADVTVTGLNIENAGEYGISHGGGKLLVTGLTVSNTQGYGIDNWATLSLAGIINATVYNENAQTVTATASLVGSSMTIDWPLDKLPAGMVGIQFANAADAQASKASIALGAITAEKYAPYFSGDQMLLMDKNYAFYTVKNYEEFTAALAHMEANDVTSATITLAGDIVIPSTVTINAGRNVTLVDDGTARTILRGTTFNTKARGVLFDVSDNASLTFKSTGTDKSPKLTVDGNRENIVAENGNWAIVVSKGANSKVNVKEGVQFIDNSSTGAGGVIRMEAGTLTIDGGQFKNNTTTNNGGVLNIMTGVTATIKDATFSGNKGSYGGVIIVANNAQLTAENCTFTGNTATANGGAITSDNKKVNGNVFRNCTFTNNTANGEGGAINASTGVDLAFEDCTFTGNESKKATTTGVPTAWGNDIRLGGATNTTSISGKMVVEIFNRNASKITVKGALEEGSDVVVDWCVTETDGAKRVPSDKVGIVFDNDATMNESQKYISLGGMMSPTYSLAYENAKGMLAQVIKVDTFAEFTEALTTIENSTSKVGVIRLVGDIDFTKTTTYYSVAIPANTNVTIEDDGTARTMRRTYTPEANRSAMIQVNAGATLTLRSTGTTENSKLILDGNNLTAKGNAPMIYPVDNANATVNIYEGVTLKNNTSTGAGAVIRVQPNGGTINIDGATFKNNTSINNSAGVLYLVAGTSANVKNAVFSGNTAKNGGAIYNNKGTLKLINTSLSANALFTENTASNWGGAIYTDGGTFEADGYTFEKNTAKYGGAILMFTASTVSNTTFTKNQATSNEGGAIYVNKSSTFTDCMFDGNQAKTNGGAICYSGKNTTVSLVATEGSEMAMFKDNTANGVGDAIYLYAGTLTGSGYVFTPSFAECVTVRDNAAAINKYN